MLLGSGGASRAIYFSLADVGVKEIDVANRTVDKAKELIAARTADVNSVALSLEKRQKNKEIMILSFRRQR